MEQSKPTFLTHSQKVELYGKEKIAQWSKTSREKQRLKRPTLFKANLLLMSLRTMKVKNRWNVDKILSKIFEPISCPYCEKAIPLNEISWDHLIPLHRGGQNEMENLQFVCMKCNFLKGTLLDDEYKILITFFKTNPGLQLLYEQRIKPTLGCKRFKDLVVNEKSESK